MIGNHQVVLNGGVVHTQDGEQLKDKDSKLIVGVVRHYYCFERSHFNTKQNSFNHAPRSA